MSSPSFLTYDGDTATGVLPYRPGVADTGGGQKLDDAAYPPDPITMPASADFNQMSFLLPALAKVTGAAILYVTNSGSPTIASLRAAGSVLTASDFTVTHHATGDVELQCVATKIPPPFAALATSQLAGDYRVSARVNATNDGIRIETRNSAGTLTDVDFLAFWM